MSQQVASVNRLQQLSTTCKWLIRKMQEIGFGRITCVAMGGAPDVTRPWRIQRTVKLASSDQGVRPESHLADFELRREHLALLEMFSSAKDGDQIAIEVRHGLPFLVEIEKDQQVA